MCQPFSSTSLHSSLSGNVPSFSRNVKDLIFHTSSPGELKEFTTFIDDVIEEKRIIEWTTLMEWFVEGVIGLDSRWKRNDWRSSLTTNDVLIDETETVRLKAPDSVSSPSFLPSFTDDLNTLCQLILDSLDALSDDECLEVPPPIQSIFSNILTSIVSVFVESGDLVLLPNFTLDSIRSSFLGIVQQINPSSLKKQLFSQGYFVAKFPSFLSHSSGVSDFSFLRISCFKPALLRLQTKFQNIAQLSLHSDQFSPNPNMISSSEPSLDWSTTAPSLAIQSSFSLNTAHLSDPTTNQSELDDGSERSDVSLCNQPSSSTSFSSLPSKQETLQILTVLHSLITAPLSPSLEPSDPPPPFLLRDKPDFSPIAHEPIDLNGPSLRTSSTKKTKQPSLTRFSDVICLANIEQFVEGLTALLESRNRQLQSAAFPLLIKLLHQLEFGEIHRNLLFSLRFAFRDGSTASQIVFMEATAVFSAQVSDSLGSVDDPLRAFDWEGMIHIKNKDNSFFHLCIRFLRTSFVRLWSISRKLAESVFLGFDKHQHAVSRMVSLVPQQSPSQIQQANHPMLGLCLILSFHFGVTLPDPIIQSIWQDSSITSSFLGFHPSFLLTHTSFNCNRHSQSVLLTELLCERLVRTSPHSIFERPCRYRLQQAPFFPITPLFGLHPLFLRGILPHRNDLHLPNFVSVLVHLIQTTTFPHWDKLSTLLVTHPPPRIVHFFTQPICYYRAHEVIEVDVWSFLLCLLPLCAPFGECRSLAMIFREFSTVRHPNAQLDEYDLAVLQAVLDLHWLSIPISFDSPLLAIASSINGISLTACDFRISSAVVIRQESLRTLILLGSRMTKGIVIPLFSKWLFCQSDRRQACASKPSHVSIALEIVARLVRVSSDAVRMEFVRRGVLDVVVVSVSHSSFLEDFENGVVLIGILLGTLRRVELSTETREFDFSSFF
ncbi:hypothetical protein BLNAU_10886 [Blattamonas nauphoetae]|uniref:Uncharacterized protein n=1 Tax=Blattamonas nauphoetae TaxID=2049346 RepID=A0ABQ9XP74_9EUKA|nr:hypothetical protein BLNAU_10886 [Blattamonas nauphoetae]